MAVNLIEEWRDWYGRTGINAIIRVINRLGRRVTTIEAGGGGGGTGDVVGPASATDNAIARYDGTTGKIVQNSAPKIEDDGRITTVTDPSGSQDAATKAYVDAIAANLGKRARVRAATTANITISTALNNGDTLDGVTLATGDLVLVKDQSTAAQNGVYAVGVSPARVAEFDTYDEHPGSLIAVEEGTVNADTLWLCTSNVGGTLNTTAIAFTQLVVTSGKRVFGFQITGNGSTPSTGQLAAVWRAPTAGTVTRAWIFGNTSGSAVVDIKKSTYSGFPTVSSITASAKPTLSSAQKNEDSTLTGWTTSFAAGDCFVCDLNSVSGLTDVTVGLEYTPS